MKRVTLEEIFNMPDFRSVEKMTWNMHVLLKRKDFKNIDDGKEYLQSFIGKTIELPDNAEPKDIAQNLAYDAFKAKSKQKKIKMAKEALEIYPDTSDAYVILAENSGRSAKGTIEFYRRALEAAERSLDPEIIKHHQKKLYYTV